MRVRIGTRQLLSLLTLAQVFLDNGALVPAHLLFYPGHLRLSVSSEELGDFNASLMCQTTGLPEGVELLHVGLNIHFLVQALRVIRTPEVAIEITPSTEKTQMAFRFNVLPANESITLAPIVLREAPGDGATDFIHVIMPMHLGS